MSPTITATIEIVPALLEQIIKDYVSKTFANYDVSGVQFNVVANYTGYGRPEATYSLKNATVVVKPKA